MEDDVEQSDEQEAAAPAMGGLLTLAVPPLVAGIAAFGGAYFLGDLFVGTPAQAASSEQEVKEASHGEKDVPPEEKQSSHAKKKKKKKKKHGDHDEEGHLLILEPMVVSLAQAENSRGRAPRLRIVVGVEGSAELLSHEDKAIPLLRDRFTSAIRGLSADTLGAPGGLDIVRASLLAEAMAVLGTDGVDTVLITDFIIT
ncbi:MAG: flagellar basal body-associated FliL family protein [Parvularcula sp.]